MELSNFPILIFAPPSSSASRVSASSTFSPNSWKENQHSVNIESDKNVFVTIYDSTCKGGEGLGVYLEGEARKITNVPLLTKALILTYERLDQKVKAAKYFLTSYPRRAYQFVPKRVWVNGDGLMKKQFVDVRHELDLGVLREGLE